MQGTDDSEPQLHAPHYIWREAGRSPTRPLYMEECAHIGSHAMATCHAFMLWWRALEEFVTEIHTVDYCGPGDRMWKRVNSSPLSSHSPSQPPAFLRFFQIPATGNFSQKYGTKQTNKESGCFPSSRSAISYRPQVPR